MSVLDRRYGRPLLRLTLPLAALLGLGLGWAFPYSSRFENALNLARPSALDSRVLLVAIDDLTLNDYDSIETWPRSLYASVLDTLSEAGAKVVGLDILLSRKGKQDEAVAQSFSAPNLVLATALGDPTTNLQPEWGAKRGVSALSPEGGTVRQVQSAYVVQTPTGLTQTVPSFAGQVAALAATDLSKVGAAPNSGALNDTAPRLLRYVTPEALAHQTISFVDLSVGAVRYADLQGRIVVIGQAASGTGLNLQDVDGQPVSGLALQGRAISTLLQPPLRRLPVWAVALLCVAVAVLSVLLGGLWAYILAGLALLLSPLLWSADVIFPGIAVSLTAVLSAALVAFEQQWNLGSLRVRDQLTGLGNRAAMQKALAQRWPQRRQRALALALIDLSGLRRVNETQGRAAGDALLREVASRLQKTKRRSDLVFRYGSDEFAVLLDQITSAEAVTLTQTLEKVLAPLGETLAVRFNVGIATVEDLPTGELPLPNQLIEAASRQRYRVKYQRMQEK